MVTVAAGPVDCAIDGVEHNQAGGRGDLDGVRLDPQRAAVEDRVHRAPSTIPPPPSPLKGNRESRKSNKQAKNNCKNP